jgi:hypothetical protein
LDNNGYKDEIFTKRVRAGKRTYFFDVKSTKSEKDFYVTMNMKSTRFFCTRKTSTSSVKR